MKPAQLKTATTPPNKPERADGAYFEQAASWSQDINGSLRTSRRIAWTVAVALGAIALAEGFALAVMMPLKTTEPYTITVDRQTGYVETARGLKTGPLSENAAITQSFVIQYILARETFDATDLRENYRKIMLWSAGDARSAYQRDLARANPESPLVLYPASTVLSTRIKSVSLLSPTTALVRFDTIRRDAGATMGEQRSYAAVMTFRFSNAPMRNDDRFLNPLGFQVSSYRRDSETTTASAVRLDEGVGATP